MSSAEARPRVGISACLLGENVRFDGGHKRDEFITRRLADYFDFHITCPEAGAGLGIPRPPVRLVGNPESPRAVGVKDPALDVTSKIAQWSRQCCNGLPELSGYLLKKDSPSCGMSRVKIYPEQGGAARRIGTGLFAAELMKRYPLLPVEEEGRLKDPVLCENFINRVFLYHRWQQLLHSGLTPAKLIEFHAAHKYLVMAHSQVAYQRMGRLLSNLKGSDLQQIANDYITELMHACHRTVSRKRHVNVLQHIMGYLKRKIDGDDKAELISSIESYRTGEIPLIVPITLFKHYFRRHPDPYMTKQVYLQPHPEKLGLRNQL